MSVLFLPGALICWLCSMLSGWEVDGAHAPMGPVKHPPAHSLGAELCLQQGLELPEAPREGWSLLWETLATDTQALLERPAPPPPTQATDLFVQLICSGLRKLPNFLGAKTSDYPGVGVGTRARAPHVPQHLSEGHHSLIPVRLGARLSREPAPLFYIFSHKATPSPLCPPPLFCKYVKRKMQTSESAGALPASHDF